MSQVNDAITNTKIPVESIYKAQSDAFGFFDYPFLIEMINQNNVRRILDIGTGEGSFIIGLAQKNQNIQIDAIDINENLVDVGGYNNDQLGLNINFRHANFGVNYTGSNYDLIIARFAIEHIKEINDIDHFLRTAYEKLNLNGWLIIVEYFIHVLDIGDVTWKKFRTCEIATYKSAKAHPRITLKLPELLLAAKYINIRSTINHISPSIIGEDNFFNLVQEYAKLYSQVAPKFWIDKTADEIVNWCSKRQFNGEPSLFTSYTIGQKTVA